MLDPFAAEHWAHKIESKCAEGIRNAYGHREGHLLRIGVPHGAALSDEEAMLRRELRAVHHAMDPNDECTAASCIMHQVAADLRCVRDRLLQHVFRAAETLSDQTLGGATAAAEELHRTVTKLTAVASLPANTTPVARRRMLSQRQADLRDAFVTFCDTVSQGINACPANVTAAILDLDTVDGDLAQATYEDLVARAAAADAATSAVQIRRFPNFIAALQEAVAAELAVVAEEVNAYVADARLCGPDADLTLFEYDFEYSEPGDGLQIVGRHAMTLQGHARTLVNRVCRRIPEAIDGAVSKLERKLSSDAGDEVLCWLSMSRPPSLLRGLARCGS